MGCGSTEADVLLTFLNLPNAHTFHTKTFARVSDAIRGAIKEISNKSIQGAREKEIKETLGEEFFHILFAMMEQIVTPYVYLRTYVRSGINVPYKPDWKQKYAICTIGRSSIVGGNFVQKI